DYDLVDHIILALNCLGNERVSLNEGESTPLRHALLAKLDLRRASASLLQALRKDCINPAEKRRLDALLSDPEGETTLAFLKERDVLDALEDLPRTRLDPQALA